MTTIMIAQLSDTIDTTHNESNIYDTAEILNTYYELQKSGQKLQIYWCLLIVNKLVIYTSFTFKLHISYLLVIFYLYMCLY